MHAQEDFVRDYAAKRAAQMERARSLREQREAQQRAAGGGAGGNYGAPAGNAPVAYPRSAPAPREQAAFQQQQQQPPQQRAPSSHQQRAGYQRQQQQQEPPRREAFDYPPPVQQQTRRPEPVSAAPSYGRGPMPQQQAPPPVTSSYGQQTRPPVAGAAQAGNGRGADSIAVTESDFRRAVSLGVISTEQAKQLWTIVSGGGGGLGSPTYASPVHAAQPAPSYDPQNYAPASAPDRRSGGGGAGGAAPGGRPSVSSSNRRPEWNAEPDLQPDDSDSAYDAPPTRVPNRTPQRTAKPQIAERPPVVDKAWNSDIAESDGGFGAPPPIPGRRGPKTTPPKEEPRGAAGGGRPAPAFDDMPVGRGGGGGGAPKADPYADAYPADAPPPNRAGKSGVLAPSAASRIAGGRRAGQPSAPPPMPEPVPQDAPEDELAEMERQKEENRRRLEAEIAEAEQAAMNEPMEECRVCGRSFRAAVIARHEQACKTSNKKRKAFDTKAQRLDIEGAQEVLAQAKYQAKRQPEKKAERPAGRDPKWKVQHLQFQAAMQAVRMQKEAEGSPGGGGGGMYVPPPAAPDDRVPCPYCNRKFAEETAKRHIPHCKNTQNRPRGVGARR